MAEQIFKSVTDEPTISNWDGNRWVKLTNAQLFKLCLEENIDLLVAKELYERDLPIFKKVKFRTTKLTNQKGVLTYVRFHVKKGTQDEQAAPAAPFVSAQRV